MRAHSDYALTDTPVRSVYLSNVGTRKHPVEAHNIRNTEHVQALLRSTKTTGNHIDEICFAGDQEKQYGKMAIDAGFKRILVTKNPNSGNRIAVYVRSPENS